MKNVRGAGRKSKIAPEKMDELLKKIALGESVSSLATEIGISKQALYKKIHEIDRIAILNLDYIINNIVITKIEVNVKNETIKIVNINSRLFERPFGIKQEPDWNDFVELLEKEFLISFGVDEKSIDESYFLTSGEKIFISLEKILYSAKCHLKLSDSSEEIVRSYQTIIRPYGQSEDNSLFPVWPYMNKSRILKNAHLTGYQIKGITSDRFFVIKSQIIKEGTLLDDWAVEIIAMDICRQLDISYLKQRECNIIIDGKLYKGLKSQNFAADGYEFVPLTRLLLNIGYSVDGFEYFDTLNKLKWCADKLSLAGEIEYKNALKYMIDLSLVDSLVGNSERNLDNIGLLYNINTGKYEIAPVFNCGQGLFEHDEYRDTYLSYESAILTVAIKPYDEDPFDMIRILNDEFSLTKLYPGLKNITYNSQWKKPYVVEYIAKMKSFLSDL